MMSRTAATTCRTSMTYVQKHRGHIICTDSPHLKHATASPAFLPLPPISPHLVMLCRRSRAWCVVAARCLLTTTSCRTSAPSPGLWRTADSRSTSTRCYACTRATQLERDCRRRLATFFFCVVPWTDCARCVWLVCGPRDDVSVAGYDKRRKSREARDSKKKGGRRKKGGGKKRAGGGNKFWQRKRAKT